MSIAVALDRLAEQLDALGPGAFLVTVGSEGNAHVVSVLVRLDGAELAAEVGRTSRANLASNPKATLLWPPAAGEPYSLIVDGTAELGTGDLIAVRPERAVLHRVAGTSTEVPSCVKLETTD
jgi:16S rRNA U1498 N3-methylase RsmE